jgi:hypothetical protein
VGEARNAQHVLQHRRELRVDRRDRPVVALRLLERLAAVERREVGAVRGAQREETEVLELLLLHVGDRHLGDALRDETGRVGREVVGRQAGDEPAALDVALDAADVGEPTRLGFGAQEDAP